jgi:hypothetical protein
MSRKTRGWAAASRSPPARIAVARRARAIALILQDAGDQIADIGFVVDDQNVTQRMCFTACCASFIVGLSVGSQRFGRRLCFRRFPVCLTFRRMSRYCEPQPHPGAARRRNFVGGIAQLDAAAVVFENAADNGEAKAGALFARRDIGLEQPARFSFGRPMPLSIDVDDDVSPSRAAITSMTPLPSSLRRYRFDGFGGVLDDVGQRLRNQPAVERAGIGSSAISTSISMSGCRRASGTRTWRTVSATSSAAITASACGQSARIRRPCA